MPVLFVSHGAPTVVLERDAYTDSLAAFGEDSPRPDGIVVVSAHWEWPGPIRVNVAARPNLIYDFSGFPPEMYTLDYPAPGSPALGSEVLQLLSAAGLGAASESSRGWDHGLWVPLRLTFPEAATPVVAVSLPIPRTPDSLMAVGRALAPLRDRRVLLVGSGGIVHNLSRLHWGDPVAPPSEWAAAFDGWVLERLERREYADIPNYAGLGPHAHLAVPTTEHFDPLFFVLGAVGEGDSHVTIYEGFRYATLSMRSFAFEPES